MLAALVLVARYGRPLAMYGFSKGRQIPDRNSQIEVQTLESSTVRSLAESRDIVPARISSGFLFIRFP